MLGLRPAKSEKDIREDKLLSELYSLRGEREELSYVLSKSSNARALIERYNNNVTTILDSPIVNKEIKDEWGDKLLIDPQKAVLWKRFPIEQMTVDEIEASIKEHTYKSSYKREDGKRYPAGHAHTDWEGRVEEMRAKLKKRTGASSVSGAF